MKIAELDPGKVYAIGSASSRYLKHVGMLLDTRSYSGLSGRYRNTEDSFTLSPTRPGKYSTREWGLPVATISQYADAKAVKALAKLNLADIEVKPSPQKIDGIKVVVQLVSAQLFRSEWTVWHEQSIREEKAREEARLAERHRQEDYGLLDKHLKELAIELGLPIPSVNIYSHSGEVSFYQGPELLEALRKLEVRQ